MSAVYVTGSVNNSYRLTGSTNKSQTDLPQPYMNGKTKIDEAGIIYDMFYGSGKTQDIWLFKEKFTFLQGYTNNCYDFQSQNQFAVACGCYYQHSTIICLASQHKDLSICSNIKSACDIIQF
ncbi:hypothetical protein ABPG74_021995 [Tetrahymena malaccensis]